NIGNTKDIDSVNKLYVYIKFIGLNKDHAFARSFDHFNKMDESESKIEEKRDFKIYGDCSSIKKDQIILCTFKDRKHNHLQIKKTIFEGTLVTKKMSIFIDWLSFQEPRVLKSQFNFIPVQQDQNIISASIFYKFNRIKILQEKDPPNEKLILKKVEKYFSNVLLKNQFSLMDKVVIITFQSICPPKDYQEHLTKAFTHDTDNSNSNLDDNSIQTLISKWNFLDKSKLTFENFRLQVNPTLYIKLWFEDKLPIGFFQSHHIDVLIQYLTRNSEITSESFELQLSSGQTR